ncbi:MAG TPA: GNAT family N-acetyltransferase [Candidatus Binatia bacterium]|jgi:ribosomal protein S18 acetylase RimI-like enzyme
MTTATIKTVRLSGADQAIATVVLAFSADPVARWFYPDPRQYLLHLPNFVRAFAGKAIEYNSAYHVDGYQGVALWLPPDVHPDEDALVVLLQHTIPEENQQEIFAFIEQMDSYHPAEPHWYLPMIGVDPGKQGNGYGSALLKYSLELCDREGKLAYLEASSTKSIPLYKRHGFELVGTIQVGSSPPLFPMLRKP